MQSKISLWNKRIMMKDILSNWPMWAAEIFFGVFGIWIMSFENLQRLGDHNEMSALAIKAMSSERRDIMEQILILLVNPALIAGLSILVAVLVFHFMYKKRDAYMMNSFPVRRETMFVSHCTAGFLMILVPGLLAYLGEFVLNFYYQIGMGKTLLMGMFESIVILIFFWSLACFVVSISGNSIMAIVIYIVLNLLETFISIMWDEFTDILTTVSIAQNGSMPDGIFTIFSPIVYLYNNAVNGGIDRVYQEDTPRELINLGNIGPVCLYLIPAVLLLGLSIYIYKKRKAEKIGDMVAFTWIESVFRVVFTICGACLFTIFIYLVGNVHVIGWSSLLKWESSLNDLRQIYFYTLIDISIGAAISFCISEMILKKRFMIWKKLSYLQGGIIIAALVVMISLIHFEVFQPAIPNGEDVEAVQICGDQRLTYTGGDIEKVRKIQEELYTDFDKDFKEFYDYIEFIYYKKDGSQISFTYCYDIRGILPEKKTNIYDFVNKQGIDAMFLSDKEQMETITCHLDYQSEDDYREDILTVTEQAKLDVIFAAMEKDLREGGLKLGWTGASGGRFYTLAMEFYPTKEFSAKYPVLSQYYIYAERVQSGARNVLYNTVFADESATNTMEAIKMLKEEKASEDAAEQE